WRMSTLPEPQAADLKGATMSPRRILTAVVCTAVLSVLAGLAVNEVEAHSGTRTARAQGVLATAPAAGRAATGARPNIVFVLADDMRADDLRFMPRVQKLIGSRGLTFRNSFSPYPLCCPARASFLSGQYAHNHGVLWNRKPWGFAAFDDSRTIATSLHRAGYHTALVGKYLNEYGLTRVKATGKRSTRYVPPGWDQWYAAAQSRNPRFRGSDPYNYFHTLFNINGHLTDRFKGRYQTKVLGGFATHVLHRFAKSRKPFFLWLSAVAPHTGKPIERGDPKSYRVHGRKVRALATPARPAWVRGIYNARIRRSAGLPADGSPSEANVSDKPKDMHLRLETKRSARDDRTLTRQRAEALYILDRQVARIIKQLKRDGTWSNTVLAFTSDNGYFLGEHRIPAGKVRAHEPSLRVPFLIAGPGIPAGERNDPVRTFDITATFLQLAGANSPRKPDGRSLVASFEADQGWAFPVVTEGRLPSEAGCASDGFADDSDGERVGVYRTHTYGCIVRPGHTYRDGRTTIGVRTARWKLIRYAGGEVELYDLDNDANELTSLAHDSAYADVLAELTQVWKQFRNCKGAACNAPLPTDLQEDPLALATSTVTQRQQVLARYGHAW
ncbi:MAG: sulfatase, partial [Nocardioidaceae bacterium]